MKALTARQSRILILITILAAKFFVLPLNLADGMHQNILPIMFLFITLELVLILLLVKIAIQNEELTFYELVQKSFGTIFAKITFAIMFILFTGKNILNLNETYLFFLNTLYDKLSPEMFIIPFAIIMIFAYVKGLTSIGRTGEILCGFIVGGLLFAMFISLKNVDITNLLPLFEPPLDSSLDTLQKNIFWFGDYFIFLLFFGQIKFSPHYMKKMFRALLWGMALIITFFTIYYCIFPYTSGIQHFGVSDITQATPSVDSFGRLDWLTSIVWTLSSIMQSVIYYWASTKTLEYIFSKKNIFILNTISLGVLCVGLYCLQFNLGKTIEFAQSPIRFIVFAFIFACVVLIPIQSKIVKRRSFYEKQSYPEIS